MPTPTCSQCKRAIPSDDVNVAQDIAYCRACNLTHPLSRLTQGAEIDMNIDLRHPPAGAWQHNAGIECVVGATHRSLGAAVGLLLVSIFWNGIVSVFVLVAVAGTMRNLDLALPHWFPAPNMNGSPMGVGMTLFLWVFLTPFILIGLAMIGALLSCLGGRTEVRIRNAEGVIFSGIGPIGWRRRFNASSVKAVRIDNQQWRDNDGDRRRKTYIVLETREGKLLKLGSGLTEERRRFVAAAVRKALKM